MIGYFIESMSLVAMILPLLIACIAMHIGAGVHSSLILRDLGVPLGLVMAFVGFNVLIGIIYYYNDEIGPGVAIGLLGLFTHKLPIFAFISCLSRWVTQKN